jgi:TonB family protein
MSAHSVASFLEALLAAMTTGVSPAFAIGSASTRSVPRYKLTVPLALTVLRAGIPNQIPGQTLEIGEGGLGVRPASRLLVGESVRIEFLVPQTNNPVRATAVVRYQHQGSFGLQFLRMPVEQQSMVRYWTRRQGDLLLTASADEAQSETASEQLSGGEVNRDEPATTPGRFSVTRLLRFAIPIAVISVLLGWWHWQQGWAELEAQLPARDASVEPKLKVGGDAMAGRIVYRVLPQYPEAARQAGVQGTVLLEVAVSAKGEVSNVKFVSGPAALSQAAMDAVRWWRYNPYLANGQPTPVETSVAVDFRLTN